MAALCGMPTIQYSAGSGPLSVHKLFTSCIRRCLVSRASDWVMSALSAVLLIFSFQFSLLFYHVGQPGSTAAYLVYTKCTLIWCSWFGYIKFTLDAVGLYGLPHEMHRALRNTMHAVVDVCVTQRWIGSQFRQAFLLRENWELCSLRIVNVAFSISTPSQEIGWEERLRIDL